MIKDVSIEITQKCLNNCIHCSSCSTEHSTVMLQLNTIKRVILGLRKLDVERICLSGGEPFLHPDIEEIVRQIADNHILADIYSCGVVTEKRKTVSLSIEKLSKLKKAGLRSILFNMQSAHENTYDLITQSKGNFPLLCESISNAVKCGIRTEIHFVPMRQNIKDAEDVLLFAEKMGVSQVNFLKLVPHGRALENFSAINPSDSDINNLCDYLLALKAQGKAIRLGLPLSASGSTPPCHAVKEKLYIKFDGAVFGCEAFKYITFQDKHGLPIMPENILDYDIVDIYNNSAYLKQSLSLVKKYEHLSVGCENCPVQKYLRDRG